MQYQRAQFPLRLVDRALVRASCIACLRGRPEQGRTAGMRGRAARERAVAFAQVQMGRTAAPAGLVEEVRRE